MSAIAATARPQTLAGARRRFLAAMPKHFENRGLDGDALTALQTRRLRQVLRAASDRSPFHRSRLAGVDLDSVTIADLGSLPVMTKAEMMASFDEAVTDPRLTLSVVNRHLESVADTPALLFDEYVVLASGGSSGVRGVFACDLAGAAEHMAAVVRGSLADLARAIGWPPPNPSAMTIVAAPTCVHATRGLSAVFLQGGLAEITYAPVTDPFEQILETVERSQPTILIGYPSVLGRIADARAEDRLSISPMVVSVTSEQLTQDEVARITDGLGVVPSNSYGTSEGLMGTAPPGSDVFDFASDLAYVEFVDADDRPVPRGQPAQHVLVTNLFNHTQPLIRYRIDDVMTAVEPADAHGHQRARLVGLSDDLLDIAGIAVHPLAVRSALATRADVADYQVRTGPGLTLHIDVVPSGALVDLAAVEVAVTMSLRRAGVAAVRVEARSVPELSRDALTGKIRRFLRDRAPD